jgi:hypothetical protein
MRPRMSRGGGTLTLRLPIARHVTLPVWQQGQRAYWLSSYSFLSYICLIARYFSEESSMSLALTTTHENGIFGGVSGRFTHGDRGAGPVTPREAAFLGGSLRFGTSQSCS